jgi:hypothetical protein
MGVEEMVVGALQNLFEHRRFVGLTGAEVNMKRVPLTVAQDVHFGGIPAARAA